MPQHYDICIIQGSQGGGPPYVFPTGLRALCFTFATGAGPYHMLTLRLTGIYNLVAPSKDPESTRQPLSETQDILKWKLP